VLNDSSSEVGPLSGLVVADFSRVLAGPYTTMMLGDLGAEVIKVESPQGDDTRRWKPPVLDGESTYFLSVNRNKRSVVLDFKDPKDLHLARLLAKNCDVMIENYMPGTLERFGLGYEQVAQDNPSVIYGTITGFGEDGGRELPGYDLVAQATSGLMSITGPKEGPPFKSGVAIVDVICGLHLAVGILAALDLRHRTGTGQRVSVSLLSAALAAMVNQTESYVATGVVPSRMGNAHPSLFPYEPFQTSDGLLVIAIGNDTQFERLCDALGDPSLAKNPLYLTNEARVVNRDKLKLRIEELLSKQSAYEWAKTLNTYKVPCGPINTIAQGISLASELGLDPIVRQFDERGKEIPTVASPISFSRTKVTYRRTPPKPNQDGETVRAWLNSLDKDETRD
jgi:crotonobetainyl-CoA:carnitine CoA-transferase CaiB-like acyl-CoA transferase